MAARADSSKAGFWRGFLVGLAAAALGFLALALARPPAPASPPAIDPAAASGPEAPAAPDLGSAPDAPAGPTLGPTLGPNAPGPLIDAGAAPARPPSLVPIDPPAGGAPSPSLAQPGGD